LFALLLWPIIFLPLPGAFETPYQLAPLDLGSDSFYTSRSAVIEKRLADMQKTSDCLAMLKEIDDRERPRGTLAVGVSWGYEANDLREIVECLGGKALSVLCRMFCEEYGHRASGVPDLMYVGLATEDLGCVNRFITYSVWNYTERRARFVEVKSPNDHLSETQKIWISVLQTAGVEVEVCHVTEIAIDERSSLRGLNKRRSDDEQSELQAKRPKRTTRRGMEEYQQSEYEEENEFDEEMRDEWAYESGNEAKIRSSRGEGVLLSRSQVSQTQGDNIPDKENSPAYFQEGALLIDAKGSSQLEGRIRPASGSIGKAQSIR
jgi:Fanconi-associated nuclease 1